jgi:hypothetical protein
MSAPTCFKKVGERLYRYSPSGGYYALLKIRGKQIKRCLETDSLPEARRKLRTLRNDLAVTDILAKRMTVEELCDQQLEMITIQAPKTVQRKSLILRRIRSHWKSSEISRVSQSDIKSWLAGLNLGAPRARQKFHSNGL